MFDFEQTLLAELHHFIIAESFRQLIFGFDCLMSTFRFT